jgi:hypothetical protein
MKKIEFLAIAILLAALVSCKKESITTQPQPQPPVNEIPTPAMTYTDLKSKTIGYRQSAVLDLNNDGNLDLIFRTELTGDAIYKQDKVLYLVESSQYCNLLVDTLTEQTPRLGLGQLITVNDPEDLNWYRIVSVTMMRKVISMNAPISWEGNWKNSGHQFLPFQVLTANGVHNGWVELVADAEAEKVTLYRSAISVEPNVTVKAGF